MRKTIAIVMIALMTLASVFANGSSESAAGGTITVGILQDTTGATATLGKSVQKGVEVLSLTSTPRAESTERQ